MSLKPKHTMKPTITPLATKIACPIEWAVKAADAVYQEALGTDKEVLYIHGTTFSGEPAVVQGTPTISVKIIETDIYRRCTITALHVVVYMNVSIIDPNFKREIYDPYIYVCEFRIDHEL